MVGFWKIKKTCHIFTDVKSLTLIEDFHESSVSSPTTTPLPPTSEDLYPTCNRGGRYIRAASLR